MKGEGLACSGDGQTKRAVTTTAVTTTVGNYGKERKKERKEGRKKRKEGRKETIGDGNCEFEFLAGGVGEERPRRLYRTSVITHTILPHGSRQSPTVNQAQGEKRWEWESFGTFVFYHLRGFLKDR